MKVKQPINYWDEGKEYKNNICTSVREDPWNTSL